LICRVQKIQYSTSYPLSWDNEAEMHKGKLDPEPPHRVLEECKPIELHASAVSDYSKYECGVTSIQFKDTFMFQSRSFNLPIKNISAVTFECSWLIMVIPFMPNHVFILSTPEINISKRGYCG
jgi:hypothetical protein